MRHELDRPIASDLSYLVQARIKRDRQLGRTDTDCTYARVQIVSGYNPRLFVADVEEGTDSANSKPTEIADVPAGYFHGRKR